MIKERVRRNRTGNPKGIRNDINYGKILNRKKSLIRVPPRRPHIQVQSIKGGMDDPNAQCHGYQGGVVLNTNVEIMGNSRVFAIYWDNWFVGRPDVVQAMNQCITELITGPYMNGLAQYQISSGVFLGSVVIDSNVDIPPNPMSDGHLMWHISNWVADGIIPFTGDLNTLFVIFTPIGTVINYAGLSSGPGGQFAGYHSAFTYSPPLNWGKNNLFYAVIPSNIFPPTIPTMSDFLGQSLSVTHEMVEAFTDRNCNGWQSKNGCEIADLCEAPPNNDLGFVSFNGWMASRFWSNTDNACSPAAGVPMNFIAIYDENNFDGYGIPNDISNKINELVGKGHVLNKVVQAPNGGWIVICDDTYWNQGFPKDAYENIDDVCDHGGTLTDVIFDPQGNWALIFDDISFEQGNSGWFGNIYFGPGFSPQIVSYVNTQRTTVSGIVFAPTGSPIVIHPTYYDFPITSIPFPDEVITEIHNQQNAGRVFTDVSFTHNWEWILNFEDKTPDLSPRFPYEVQTVLNSLTSELNAPNPTGAFPGPGFRSLTFFS